MTDRVKTVRNAIEERLRKRCVLITWAAAEDAAEAAIEANDAWLREQTKDWPLVVQDGLDKILKLRPTASHPTEA